MTIPSRAVDELLTLAERSETTVDGQVVINYVFEEDITIAEYLALTKHLSEQPHTIVTPGMTCVAFNLRLNKHDGAFPPRIQDGVFVPLVVRRALTPEEVVAVEEHLMAKHGIAKTCP